MSDNELIAEFMNAPDNASGAKFTLEEYLNKGLYHKSWDWLMPVVEKIYLIRTVELEMSIGQLRINCLLHGGFFGSAFCIAEKTSIECWYMSVVEFIKWYNETQAKS